MNTLALLDRFFNDHDFTNSSIQDFYKEQTYYPRVDLKEVDDKYLMEVDLPGLTSEDVKIEIKDGVLTLEGERSYKNENNFFGYFRKERSYGKFSRSFNFGHAINDSEINAEMKNGVLKLDLPKLESKKTKQIKVL